MQISQTWLRELIGSDWQIDPAELESAFAEIGIEIENRFASVPFTGPVVIARVSHIEELTDFKKPIRYCQVDIGQADPIRIICGARNFTEGDVVIAALPGAVLPGNFVISSRETYGKVSQGMLCAASELGVSSSKNDDHGIITFDQGAPKIGTSLVQAWNLNDNEDIFELDITPDRSYLLSARGIARDLANKYSYPFTDPAEIVSHKLSGSVLEVQKDVAVVIIDPAAKVSRFVLQRVNNAKADAATPWWIRLRLTQAGFRTINLAADITNYVMVELGQPLHAYDGNKVGNSWTVTPAGSDQSLITLDGKTRKLDPEDIILKDESGILGLAGVMGGFDSEVTAETTSVIFEAAIWDPVLISRTSKRHKLPSEAAKRFIRGVDPELPLIAARRAAELYAEYSGGTIASELTDQAPQGITALT